MQSTEPIDHLFREGLEELEMAPPPAAWQGIERKLDRKKIYVTYYPWAAVAAVLILAVFLYWPSEQTAITSIATNPSTNNPTISSPAPTDNLTAAVVTVKSSKSTPVKGKKKQQSVETPAPIAPQPNPDIPVNENGSNPMAYVDSLLPIASQNSPLLNQPSFQQTTAAVSGKKTYDLSLKGAAGFLTDQLQEVATPVFSVNKTDTRKNYTINLGIIKIRRSVTI